MNDWGDRAKFARKESTSWEDMFERIISYSTVRSVEITGWEVSPNGEHSPIFKVEKFEPDE